MIIKLCRELPTGGHRPRMGSACKSRSVGCYSRVSLSDTTTGCSVMTIERSPPRVPSKTVTPFVRPSAILAQLERGDSEPLGSRDDDTFLGRVRIPRGRMMELFGGTEGSRCLSSWALDCVLRRGADWLNPTFPWRIPHPFASSRHGVLRLSATLPAVSKVLQCRVR